MTLEQAKEKLETTLREGLSHSEVVPLVVYLEDLISLYIAAGGNLKEHFPEGLRSLKETNQFIGHLVRATGFPGLSFTFSQDSQNSVYVHLWEIPAPKHFAIYLQNEIKLKGEGTITRAVALKWLPGFHPDSVSQFLTQALGQEVTYEQSHMALCWTFKFRNPKVDEYQSFVEFLEKATNE